MSDPALPAAANVAAPALAAHLERFQDDSSGDDWSDNPLRWVEEPALQSHAPPPPAVAAAAAAGGIEPATGTTVADAKPRSGSDGSEEDWDVAIAAGGGSDIGGVGGARADHAAPSSFAPLLLRGQLMAAAQPASEVGVESDTLLAYLTAPARRGPGCARPLPPLVTLDGRILSALRPPVTVDEAVAWLQSCCPRVGGGSGRRPERAQSSSGGGGGGVGATPRSAPANPASVAVMAAREALRQCGVIPDFSVSFAVKRQRVVDAIVAHRIEPSRAAEAAPPPPPPLGPSDADARYAGLTRLDAYARILADLAEDESYRMTVQVCRMDVADTLQVSAAWAFAYAETVCSLYRENFFGHAIAVAADFCTVVRKFHGCKLCPASEPVPGADIEEGDMVTAGSLMPTAAVVQFPLPRADQAAVVDSYGAILRVAAKIGAPVSVLPREHSDVVIAGSVGATALHLLHAALNDAFMLARTPLEQARFVLLQEDIRAHRVLGSGRHSLRTAAKGLSHLCAIVGGGAAGAAVAVAESVADAATSPDEVEAVAYLECGALAGLQLCALGRSPLTMVPGGGAVLPAGGDSSTDDYETGSDDDETPASRESAGGASIATTTVSGHRVDSMTSKFRGEGGSCSLFSSPLFLLRHLVRRRIGVAAAAGQVVSGDLFRSQERRMKFLLSAIHATAGLCLAPAGPAAAAAVAADAPGGAGSALLLAPSCHVFNRARALYSYAVQCCANSDADNLDDADSPPVPGGRPGDATAAYGSGGSRRFFSARAPQRAHDGADAAVAVGALVECVLMLFRADASAAPDSPRSSLVMSELCRNACVLLERAANGSEMYLVAVEALETALRVQVARGGVHAIALGRMHRRIASLCARQGDCARGLRYFELVLRECMEKRSFDEIVFVVSKMQDMCLEASKLREAKDVIEQAMAYFQAVGLSAASASAATAAAAASADGSTRGAAAAAASNPNPYLRRLTVMLGSMCMSVGAYDVAISAFSSCGDQKPASGSAMRAWLAKVRCVCAVSARAGPRGWL